MDYVADVLSPRDLACYLRRFREREWKTTELTSDAEYARVVARCGAKQCPGCGIGIQRDFGCVHMTCPNGHQFCFTCLRVWETCNCSRIPYDELRAALGAEYE